MISNALQNLFEDTILVCSGAVYAEQESDLHNDISANAWERFKNVTGLKPPAKIIDVGCGMGVGLRLFSADGFEAHGLTTSAEEIAALSERFTVFPWDFHEVARFSKVYDAAWVRHAAEHSFAPFMLLRGVRAALKDGGFLYFEVPGPDTACSHESNVSHFSVMGETMWRSLLARSGFQLLDAFKIDLRVQAGDDIYTGAICRAI